MKHRILAVLLVLCLFAGLIPAVHAAGYADELDVAQIAEAFVAFCDGYEGTYTAVTAKDSNALSIGVLQWHGIRAKDLLQRIINANPAKMASLLSPALFNEIQGTTSWANRSITSAEAVQIAAVLGTPEGVSAQNEQAQADVTSYVSHGWSYGVRTDAAMLYYCFIENGYGQGGAKTYIINPVKSHLGSSTINCLDDFHSAVLACTNKNYFGYRTATYNYIKALGWNSKGPEDRTSVTRPSQVFTDVKENSWYAGAVDFALEKNLFNGTSPTTFSPNKTMTRGMLVTVLYRMAGEPAVSGSANFTDVRSDKYYAKAVLWASQKGIVNGLSANTFGPDDSVTREQLATILYRYALYAKRLCTTPNNPVPYGYDDAAEISDYALKGVLWAIQNGIIIGSGNTTDGFYLKPRVEATRAEVAIILMRYIRNAMYCR